MTPERFEEAKMLALRMKAWGYVDECILVQELIAAVPVWRPVSESPEDEWVLATDGNGVFEAYRSGEYWYDTGDACYPTHWQPLPAPPKEQA